MPKISELNAITSVANTDLLMVVHDPSGSPSTNKVTLTNLGSSVTRVLNYASNTTPGVIKVGTNLTINATGYLNAQAGGDGGGVEGVYTLTIVNDTTNYIVANTDVIVFADPNGVDSDITIVLPTTGIVSGQEFLIKNINPGANHKVTVTTDAGVEYGSNYIEDPITGSFIVSYDIGIKGESHTWIYDGTAFRHLAELSSAPVFYASTNSYHQVVIQNPSADTAASSDWVAYNDEGNYAEGTGPFIDMGINSSTYNDTTYGNIWGSNDAYLYNQGGNLIIASQSANSSIKLAAGNTNFQDIRLSISSSNVTVNSSLYITSNAYNWSFNTDGSISLPNQSHTGWNWNYNLNGPTLRLSNQLNEVIVTGPSPNSSNPNSQRMILQGQRGYGTWGQNVAGEGGDIYIWAGVGGESDTGTGGTGGDVKIRGGEGQDNEGGYIRIEAGDATHWSGSSTGYGGFIDITAGSVNGGDSTNYGGNINISAGLAYNDSTKSGVINLKAGGSISSPTQQTWTFGTDGSLTLPANGDIKNSDGYSVIKSIPQNEQSSASDYTLVLSDAGKHVYKNEGEGYSVVVPTNADVAFPIGTVITVVSGNSWTYIYPADGMTTEVWGAGYNTTSSSFYIPDNSMATLLKIGTDKWMLSGAGLGNDV